MHAWYKVYYKADKKFENKIMLRESRIHMQSRYKYRHNGRQKDENRM